MVMTLRQAAEQALKTLEILADDERVNYESWDASYAAESFMALHAALAEPDVDPCIDGSCDCCWTDKESQNKAEQEPYCYVYTENGEEYFAPPTAYVPDNAKPLYTAPKPRREVELTDKEIRDLWSWSMTAEAERTTNTQQHAFARAVIEAYKAKQGEMK